MKKKIIALIVCLSIVSVCFVGCTQNNSTAKEESSYQTQLMQQAGSEVGMPNITEFYEKKLAKEIFELRDDSSLVCYAYTKSDMTGKYVFLGRCMGYGLPYSTQYTCPETPYWGDYSYSQDGLYRGYSIPQADPNGLYSPDGLSATWLWLIDETTGEANIIYAEPEIIVSQSKMPARLCEEWSLPNNY